MAPFKYASSAAFLAAIDNTIPGQMRDCGECHVGGGAMEYVPALQPQQRVPLRTLGDGSVAASVNGTTVGSGDYTAFNYFIDQYGASGNGSDATFTVMKNDFSVTGVLEMDCFMCHLSGYSWEHRRDAIRVGKFDSSRAAGSGLGTAVTGTTVDYDSSKVEADANGNLKLKAAVAAGIVGTPLTENCGSCHSGREVIENGVPHLAKQVDWKKRGDQWIASTSPPPPPSAPAAMPAPTPRTWGSSA
jgi:mono/diheme cytochrome c family protein